MEHTVETTKNPLAEEKIGKLIARFAIPAIISMLVSSLYNIVDQIFIGQGVGMLGNAATNIAFPVSIICTATALLLGIGSASNYNLETGKGNVEEANKIAGTGLGLLFICGVIIAAIVLLFLNPLLYLFGVTGCAAICTGLYIYYSLWNPVSGIYNRWNASDSCGQKPDLFHDLHACGRNYQHDFRPVIYFYI